MVSKNQIKFITFLHQKKYRQKHKLFLAEGTKVIVELYTAGLKIFELYSTTPIASIPDSLTTLISPEILKKISSLKTPNTALAIMYMPEKELFKCKGVTVVLDSVRDPGNLGTIIRLCDWFGVKILVCSLSTVDCYNAKVIQATMGSIARVSVHYMDIALFLKEKAQNIPIYGTFLNGKNVYSSALPPEAILVMGNESLGISAEVEQFISEKITIPRFGALQATESLNVATATAIFLSEFHRSIET